jgi:hypothetical protein
VVCGAPILLKSDLFGARQPTGSLSGLAVATARIAAEISERMTAELHARRPSSGREEGEAAE